MPQAQPRGFRPFRPLPLQAAARHTGRDRPTRGTRAGAPPPRGGEKGQRTEDNSRRLTWTSPSGRNPPLRTYRPPPRTAANAVTSGGTRHATNATRSGTAQRRRDAQRGVPGCAAPRETQCGGGGVRPPSCAAGGGGRLRATAARFGPLFWLKWSYGAFGKN